MPKRFNCEIHLLDGKKITVNIANVHTSPQLLKLVCGEIGIKETCYFGFNYSHPKDNEITWIDQSKPLNKELKKASNRLNFGVQFYPQCMQLIYDDFVRYQFMLQVRRNLLIGRWTCSVPTHALLASFICQGEFGDYNYNYHANNYLREAYFMPSQGERFLEKVENFHEAHKFISSTDADKLYLDSAQKISVFGMELWSVMDLDGNTVLLGLNWMGVSVVHNHTVIHTFVWPIVSNVRVNAKEIVIDVKAQIQDKVYETSIGFTCTSLLNAKRILKFAKAYREFILLGAGPISNPDCQHVSRDQTSFERVSSVQFSKNVLKIDRSLSPENLIRIGKSDSPLTPPSISHQINEVHKNENFHQETLEEINRRVDNPHTEELNLTQESDMLSRTVNDKNTLIEDDFDTEMVVIEISDTMSKS